MQAAGRSVRAGFVVAALVQALPSFGAVALFAVLRKGQVSAAHAALALVVALALAAMGLRLEDRLAASDREPATKWVLASVALAGSSLVFAAAPLAFVAVALLGGALAVVLRDREVPVARA